MFPFAAGGEFASSLAYTGLAYVGNGASSGLAKSSSLTLVSGAGPLAANRYCIAAVWMDQSSGPTVTVNGQTSNLVVNNIGDGTVVPFIGIYISNIGTHNDANNGGGLDFFISDAFGYNSLIIDAYVVFMASAVRHGATAHTLQASKVTTTLPIAGVQVPANGFGVLMAGAPTGVISSVSSGFILPPSGRNVASLESPVNASGTVTVTWNTATQSSGIAAAWMGDGT